ncbi:glycerate kinase [Candidatus Poribacteria bacterium]|nr:glycerate kinase [Candidatus Poribacteria bacterium]
MKIVIAPDSFKGSLTAKQAADAIATGFQRIYPDAVYELIPMADGGEGSVQSLVDATGGRLASAGVTGPMGAPTDAVFGILGDGKTAVIEMAAASGLTLVPPDERDPMRATTYGTGELIARVLDEQVTRLIACIGGSATNDGGAGMAQALGVRLTDVDGADIACGGGGLAALHRIDVAGADPRLARIDTIVACDVANPLTGPDGASAVYGPQKGATPDMIAALDRNLGRFGEGISRDLGIDVSDVPGAGAAGGLGAGMMAFLGAELESGVSIILDAVDFDARARGASLCITGEGEISRQTAFGKTPVGVASSPSLRDVPVVALCGAVADDADAVYAAGIDAAMPIVPGPVGLETAVADAMAMTEAAAERLARLVRAGSRVSVS